MAGATDGEDPQPKRRACDECRSRKLGCIKEPGGCARCKREGIECKYSPQKPMGRPRRRPFAAEGARAKAFPKPGTIPVSSSAADLDPSSSAPAGSDVAFLHLLGTDHVYTQPLDPVSMNLAPTLTHGSKGIWHFGIANVDFDANGAANAMGSSEQWPSPERAPGLSSQEATPPGPKSADTPAPNTCTCSTSLHVSLDSFRSLPNDVAGALKVARGAAKAVHAAVKCPVCSPPSVDTTATVAPAFFHNTLLLGALFPSIAEAYHRILDMADEETARATVDGRQLTFALEDYGGLWGSLAGAACFSSGSLDAMILEPLLWRRTIRTLLKADIYGASSDPEDPNVAYLPCTHIGLKDLVAQVDERARVRYQQQDAMIAAGLMPKDPAGCAQPSPTWQGIISTAKSAMDRLIIA